MYCNVMLNVYLASIFCVNLGSLSDYGFVTKVSF